jgi:uncharacterized membrane protein YdbT with pleckstrin-like domain
MVGDVAQRSMDLMPGETMVLSSHPHWWYFWKYAASLVAILVLFWLAQEVGWGWLSGGLWWIATAALLVDLVATAFRFAQWQTTRFAVTDRRVAYQSGLISRHGVSIPINRVNNVNFHQGAIARLLGNGNVVIESAGETGESVFENIPHPEHVRQVIFNQMDVDENKDAARDADAIAQALARTQPPTPGPAATSAPAASSADPQVRLQQLEQLRAQDLITDAEYQAKRAEILGNL